MLVAATAYTHEEEINDIKKELENINKELQCIKEVNGVINSELAKQGEKLDVICEQSENTQLAIQNSNKHLETVQGELQRSESKKYQFVTVLTGAIFLPVSLKIAASVLVTGMLFSKFT